MARFWSTVVAAAAIWAESSNARVLGPVKGPGRRSNNMAPSKNIELHYGANAHSLVNVSLSTHKPAVLLEDIASVASVAYHGSISLTSTLSGTLKYSVSSATLTQLSVDFDTSLSADLGVTVDVGAPYDTTFTYSAPALSYDLVNIPGIITIGPELLFGVGVDLGANGAVTVAADVGVAVTDGNVHIDFQNSSSSSTSGWTPDFTSAVNITEKAALSVDPFINLSVELAFNVLGGLLDLSFGLEAQPRFNNDFVLAATQDISPTTVAQPTTSGACTQGVEVNSEFVFDLFANNSPE
ncbi:hypothetical protein SCUCBS95973_008016 [Sporothrix curviconia]|uniref:DUF7223 domain-containing protein n=1 Tax=Sporothrix curviconia TaxID=1260050 RepID=A0ABP0CI16_9PEZI